MNIFKILSSDVSFVSKFKSGRFRKIKSLLSPSFICCLTYRFSVYFNHLRLPLLPRLLWWFNFIVFKVDLDHRSRLLGGLYFPHPMGIVVGQYAQSYKNATLKIMQGVTIGGDLGKSKVVAGKKMNQPIFTCNAFIGVNAMVIGPVLFESTVFITAGSIVTGYQGEGCYFGVNRISPLKLVHKKELKIND